MAPVTRDRGLGARIRERWLALRNRLLASPRFQSWAAAFPVTRPIAQRRARGLFDLVAGFVYSQVLFACIKLRLFPMLRDGPLALSTLAARLDLSEPATSTLLRAAETLGLVERLAGDRYTLGAQGAALIGNPGVSAMIDHHGALYRDLADPVALLRGQKKTDLSSYWPYAGSEQPSALQDKWVADYTALMSESQSLISSDVLDAYSLKGYRCLLDIGGGDGAFLAAAASRWPTLRLLLFDLPPVAERARARFAREGLSQRAEAVGGDMIQDSLPQGADIVSLIRVVHDHDDAGVQRILRAAYDALPTQGTLILAEPMAGTRGAEPVGHAYFGFYLLAMGSGRPRSPEELEAMLRTAGFRGIRAVRTRRPMLTSLLLAHKP
jgi:demethylspheroidene O-methyltransferase